MFTKRTISTDIRLPLALGSAFCPKFSRNSMFSENFWIRKLSEIFCFVQCMSAVFRDFLASKTDVVLDV